MRKQRKIFLIFIVVLLMTGLCACSVGSSDSNAGNMLPDGENDAGSVLTDGEGNAGSILSGRENAAESAEGTENAQKEDELSESAASSEGTGTETEMNADNFYVKANGEIFTAVFSDNSSAEAFRELLADGDVVVSMHDYGEFEKVGDLGTALPRNDTQITTEPGDVILYQGDRITVYYDINSWNFTRLGKIGDTSKEELLAAFGEGDVTVTFSLSETDEGEK